MTLQRRLLFVLIGIVAAGLLITDVVVYTQIRSFMLGRVEPQLQAASIPISRDLRESNRSTLHLSSTPSQQASSAHGSTTLGSGGSVSSLEPAGTFGELIDASGKRVGNGISVTYSGGSTATPVLSSSLLRNARPGVTFDVTTGGSNSVTYRLLIRRAPGNSGLRMVVAVPITDVTDTLGRLLLLEVLVSAAVLIGLGALSWRIVRLGLRPLDDMADVAGEIAGGALGRRVTPADERTEVGRLGLALNSMLGEIERAFAARAASEERLRRFLADASHELRTPVTSIRGYAELFDRGANERPEDLATSMRHIREEATRMGVLVDDLLLLARLDQERPFDGRDSDLVDLVTKTVSVARLTAEEHPIVLRAPDVLPVHMDPDRIRQVLDNLIGNALRYSPRGQPVEVTVRAEDHRATIEVRDHGPGVPEAEAAKIFKPFYRADAGRDRSSGGAGLGLAIASAIVQRHAGTIEVSDADGGGALFRVGLPRTIGVATPDGSQQSTPRDNRWDWEEASPVSEWEPSGQKQPPASSRHD